MSSTKIQQQRRDQILLPSGIFGAHGICKLCEAMFSVTSGYSSTYLHVCGPCVERMVDGEVKERRRKEVSIESVDRWDSLPAK